MSSCQQGASHKRHQDVKLLNQKDEENHFRKKKKKNQTIFCHMWEYSRAVIYKKVNRTSLWHMLWLIPRTAVSKKASNLIITASSQNKGSSLVCLVFLPPPPQSEALTPNNTIEYANYLHIKSTPRKTKSIAQTTVQGYRAGLWGAQTPFLPTWFSSIEGTGGQAYGGDDTEMIYPKSMQIKFFG